MATTDGTGDTGATRRLDIWPHCSLDRKGTLALFGAVAIALTLVTVRSPAPLLWPVGASCLAAFSGLAAAFWLNNRAARLHEAVEIDPVRVRVVRRHPAGLMEACEFSTHFVRVEVTSDRQVHHRLVLTERARTVSLGEFLSATERKGLGEELRKAIAHARTGA